MKKLLVSAEWDEDSGSWVATSDDIPGLVAEARTMNELVERVRAISPDLIQENMHLFDDFDVPDLVDIHVQSTIRLQVATAH